MLAVAGIMQLNIPKDKNTVPPDYAANMIVAADTLCNENFLGTPQAHEYLLRALYTGKFYEEFHIWQQWHDNGRKK